MEDKFQQFQDVVEDFLSKVSNMDGSTNPSEVIKAVHKLDEYEHELRRILVKMEKVDKMKEEQIFNFSQKIREDKIRLINTCKKTDFDNEHTWIFDDENLYDKEKLTDTIKTVEDKWKLLPAFMKARGIIKQHIESFDYFLKFELKKILNANSLITCTSDPKWYMKYTDIKIGEPHATKDNEKTNVTPHLCRLSDTTYAAPILVDIEFVKNKQRIAKKGIHIGDLPIMLRSSVCVLRNKSYAELAKLGECPLDPGGYFIVNGLEKVILIQEQLSKNRIIIEVSPKGEIQSSVTSSVVETKSKTYVSTKNGSLILIHNKFTEGIPIAIVFKAMGVESDQEICQLIGKEEMYLNAMAIALKEAASHEITNRTRALEWIGGKISEAKRRANVSRQDEAHEAFRAIILAHIPVHNGDFKPKYMYLALMVRRTILAMNDPTTIDDKDYYGNKRLELAGSMVSFLFEDTFKFFNSMISAEATKKLGKANNTNIFDVAVSLSMNKHIISGGLKKAIATGNWTLKRFKMERAGITQILSRLSFIGALGMITRISSQFEKTRKVSGPRSLQPSQWGMLCPSDTPEGESCGLVKNLALLTHVTMDSDERPLTRLSYDLGVEDIHLLSGEDCLNENTFLVFLNGNILGVHRKPEMFVSKLRQLRRAGKIQEFVSLYIHNKQRTVYIASDGGRVCRPLIIVENMKPKITPRHVQEVSEGVRSFGDFIRDGLIEFLDVNEENDSFLAMREEDINKETTHLEIEPLTLLGVVAGLIPYPHHNQSPRNTYQCAMGKQAIGSIAYNQYERFDSLMYLLVYPHKPMVASKTLSFVNFASLPAGHNAIVAVMSYSGYDIEDALVVNRSSIDRGYGRCMVFKKFNTTIKKYSNDTVDQLRAPTKEEKEIPDSKFSMLDDDGICSPGEKIQNGKFFFNKFVPSNAYSELGFDNKASTYESKPVKYNGADGVIDKVMLTNTEDNNKLLKVIVRSTRIPELGDKFSSRHGQKGVCGIIVNQEDMPFNIQGICPDMIMNPHGFPSRMTVGKMIELLGGKAGLCEGRTRDGTAFGGDKVEEIGNTLIDHGYSYGGKEYLTSGVTGEPLNSYIFFGPIYYQKLKHMVMDKMHARSRGPKTLLTRQPTEGRAKNGGLRLGEMERDCLVAYGASQLLIERLMVASDEFTVHVCESCGFMGYQNWCQYCKTDDSLNPLKIPYACKLLFQELISMNVVPKLRLKDGF